MQQLHNTNSTKSEERIDSKFEIKFDCLNQILIVKCINGERLSSMIQ